MFGKSKEKKNNDNELESYGVWVKHGNTENDGAAADSDNASMDFNSELDLPDFDTEDTFSDSDFSDMFKDDGADNNSNDLDFDTDTTLSADELANITTGDIETTEIEESGSFDDFTSSLDDDDINLESEFNTIDNTEDTITEESSDIFSQADAASDLTAETEETSAENAFTDDFSMDDLPDFTTEESAAEETSVETTPAEENAVTDDFSMDDLPDFTTEETNGEEVSAEVSTEESPAEETFADFTTEESPAEETSADFTTEETSDEEASAEVSTEESPAEETFDISSDGEEEISLDDFMEDGFSDESVASGNNGFEPGAEPAASGADEEVSLDDFFDGESFESSPEAPAPQEDTITDEPPLDMEISFDDSVDTVETEDNIAATQVELEDDYEEESEEEVTETPVEEEVSMDSFESSSSSENIQTEEVDLSDFGID